MIATTIETSSYRGIWDALLDAAAMDAVHERRVCRLLELTPDELTSCLSDRRPDVTGVCRNAVDRYWARFRVHGETLSKILPDHVRRQLLAEDSDGGCSC